MMLHGRLVRALLLTAALVPSSALAFNMESLLGKRGHDDESPEDERPARQPPSQNPAVLTVHFELDPHNPFGDAVDTLLERLQPFPQGDLSTGIRFNDQRDDLFRWVYLTTTQMFSSVFKLFKRCPELDEEGDAQTYDIYVGPAPQTEEEQLRCLRAAGIFFGIMNWYGFVLDQRLPPEFYCQLLDVSPCPHGSARLSSNDVYNSRLGALVAGAKDSLKRQIEITRNGLYGVADFIENLIADMKQQLHGVSFGTSGTVPNVNLSIVLTPTTPRALETLVAYQSAYATRDSPLSRQTWRALTGMWRYPIQDGTRAIEYKISIDAWTTFRTIGFRLDQAHNTIHLLPLDGRRSLDQVFSGEYFELALEYAQFKKCLRGRPMNASHPEVVIALGNGDVFDAIIPLMGDSDRLAQSTILLADRQSSIPDYMKAYEFFFVALAQLAGPNAGLFDQVDDGNNAQNSRTILEISAKLPGHNEEYELLRYTAAGLVWAKAFQERVDIPFVLSDRLLAAIFPAMREAADRPEVEMEHEYFLKRTDAFVEGVQQVLPPWVLSACSSRLLRQIFDASRWQQIMVEDLGQGFDATPPQTTVHEIFNGLCGVLSRLSPSQLSLFFWKLRGRLEDPIEVAFGSPLPELSLQISPTIDKFTVEKALIQVPSNTTAPKQLLRALNLSLSPALRIRMMGCASVESSAELPIEAPVSKVFEALYGMYLQGDAKEFISKQFNLSLLCDGKVIRKLSAPEDYHFLALSKAVQFRELFTYHLDGASGYYELTREPSYEGAQVALSKVRFVATLIANMLILHGRVSEIRFGPRLQRLTYYGRDPRGASLVEIEAAFLEEFELIAPRSSIQALAFAEWSKRLDPNVDKSFLAQRLYDTVYEYFLDLGCLTLAGPDGYEPSYYPTLEQFLKHIDENMNQFANTRIVNPSLLRAYVAGAFSKEHGLFSLGEDGTYHLADAIVKSEEQQLWKLRMIGILISVMNNFRVPLGIRLAPSINFCIKHGGLHPDGASLPDLLKKRFEALVREGIFFVKPPTTYHLLSMEQVALLSEWQMWPGLEALLTEPGISGLLAESPDTKRAYSHLCEAFASLPQVLRECFLGRARGSMQISRLEDSQPVPFIFAIGNLGDGYCKMRRGTPDIILLRLCDSPSEYRALLQMIALGIAEPLAAKAAIGLFDITLGDRLATLRFIVEGSPECVKFPAWREKSFGATIYRSYVKNPEIFAPGTWSFNLESSDGSTVQGRSQRTISNEAFTLLLKGIVDPDFGLFTRAIYGHYCFSGRASYADLEDANPLEQADYAGRMFAMAFIWGLGSGIKFEPVLYRMLLHEGTLDSFDYPAAPQRVEPLIPQKLFSNQFRKPQLYIGSEAAYPLRGNDHRAAITDRDLSRFMPFVARRLLVSDKERMKAFVDGFHKIVSLESLKLGCITPEDIQDVIYGQPEINVQAWRDITVYPDPDLSADHPLVRWFWEVVEGLSPRELEKLLRFITGLSHAPCAGFNWIPGGKFTIRLAARAGGSVASDLPAVAEDEPSTLELYLYESKGKLREALLKAITAYSAEWPF